MFGIRVTHDSCAFGFVEENVINYMGKGHVMN